MPSARATAGANPNTVSSVMLNVRNAFFMDLLP
jgi:hypothetical protein